MPAFQYKAYTQQGQKKTGVLEADSARSARQLLRDQGLLPTQLTETHKTLTKKSKMNARRRQSITHAELMLLTRQLATLLAAGLPIAEVLTAVAEQTEKPRTRTLLFAVRSKVMEGYTLASALAEFPHAFSNLYCATIAAGEASGHLDVVLQRLADYTMQQYEMRQKIMHALIYPIIMIIVAVSITGFLLEYVVPKMVAVYSTTGQALPGLTQILISISKGLQAYGIYGVLFLLGLGIGVRWQLQRSVAFRTRVHQLLLKIPLLGHAIRTVNTARFARTLAILSGAGVSLLEAMRTATNLVTSLPIRVAVTHAVQQVREGASIHRALKQTGYFPAMSIHMIASGEASGQLETMLERTASYQENEIQRLIATLLALFEPAIILVMGSIVLFIVLAVLLPIFQLDQFAG